MRIFGVLAVANLLVLAQSDNINFVSPSGEDPSLRRKKRKRQLSKAAVTEKCTLKVPKFTTKDVTPVFVPGFPGSGSSFVRTLIPLLTGFRTGVPREYQTFRSVNVVALKTHYPMAPRLAVWDDEVHRAVILLRNPLYAIPSYCNYMYEHENGLQIHSVKAPMEYWIKWRTKEFEEALFHWVNMLEFWMDKTSIEDRFILPFEVITSEVRGPRTAQRLADFFVDSGVKPVNSKIVPCVWSKALFGKDPLKHLRQNGGTKRKGKRKHPFEEHQMDSMIAAIEMLRQKYSHATQLVRALDMYQTEILSERQMVQEKLS